MAHPPRLGTGGSAWPGGSPQAEAAAQPRAPPVRRPLGIVRLARINAPHWLRKVACHRAGIGGSMARKSGPAAARARFAGLYDLRVIGHRIGAQGHANAPTRLPHVAHSIPRKTGCPWGPLLGRRRRLVGRRDVRRPGVSRRRCVCGRGLSRQWRISRRGRVVGHRRRAEGPLRERGGSGGGGSGSAPSASCSRGSSSRRSSSGAGLPAGQAGRTLHHDEATAATIAITMISAKSAQIARPTPRTIFSPVATGAVTAAAPVRTSQYSLSRFTTIG